MRKIWRKTLSYVLVVTIFCNMINMPVYAQGNTVTEATSETLTEEIVKEEMVSDGNAEISITDEKIAEEETIDVIENNTWDQTTIENVYESEDYRVIFTLTSYWDKGYNANIRLENIGEITLQNWYLCFDYDDSITNIWNAEIYSNEDNKYIIKNAGWNQDINVGESVEFGISGEQAFKGFPKNYEFIGTSIGVSENDYAIQYSINSDWETGFSSSILLINNSDTTLEDWVLEFDFDREITEIWNGVIESHVGNHYVIKNANHNANILSKQNVSIGFNGKQGSVENVPYNYRLESYKLYNGDSSELDTDGDGIVDGLETALGIDYKKVDTDGDGLNDYVEFYVLATNPAKVDTDEDGVVDSLEDLDGDGLNNKEELDCGTDPTKVDTDGDDLSDYVEIVTYGSNPLKVDTDGDALNDYDDVALGFSPLKQDTDGDGVLDPYEKLEQSVEETFDSDEGRGVTKVTVSMNLNGNIERNVGITNVYEFDSMSRGVVGLVGVPVEINSKVDFDSATITFTYDETALGNVKEENLAVLWYDEENEWYQILDRESVVDTVNNTVSYNTTHFSTYMLVDREGWYEAWRENIDYRISSDGETQIHYFDIAFVVDVSGSMGGSRIADAKTAIIRFLEAMQDDDAAALIRFNSNAYVVNEFTSDTATVRKGVDSLAASGGTNVNNGLVKALSTFEGRDSEREKIVVLICDGDVNYYQSTIDKYVSNNIRIYAINVQNSTSHANLEKMTKQTGGEYYYSASGDELDYLLGEIQNVTIDKIDPTDNDEDGLYDIYETAGIKMQNGQVVYLKPYDRDTDRDGLTDFQETGLVYNVDDRYIGNFMTKEVKYFRMHSDPTKEDTDGDGIKDSVDANPWMADEVVIELEENHGYQYLNIVDENGNFTDAGNQVWWSTKTNNTEDNFVNFLSDISLRLWNQGCGVIAMTDLEIYLAQKNGYDFTYPFPTVEFNDTTKAPIFDSSTGCMDRDEYMSYVEYNSLYKYILSEPLNYFTGVCTWDMESGIRKFLKHNNAVSQKVSWAPYALQCASDERIAVAEQMEKMLSENIPVVFAYYTPDKDRDKKLPLYSNEEGAKNRDDTYIREYVSSHYMTVLGLIKSLNAERTGYDYVMKVASWGEIYYINYQEYSKNFSSFSNILSIE